MAGSPSSLLPLKTTPFEHAALQMSRPQSQDSGSITGEPSSASASALSMACAALAALLICRFNSSLERACDKKTDLEQNYKILAHHFTSRAFLASAVRAAWVASSSLSLSLSELQLRESKQQSKKTF